MRMEAGRVWSILGTVSRSWAPPRGMLLGSVLPAVVIRPGHFAVLTPVGMFDRRHEPLSFWQPSDPDA